MYATSPVRKYPSNAIPAAAKACGQYINSARAVQDAQRRGFDEAILLNQHGDVSEGSGENLFVVKNGSLLTNGIEADILMGVTRESILQIAHDLSIPARIGTITVDDMLTADELFFSGTAVEVTAIREVDGMVIGDGTPGAVTRRIQQTFNEAVRGQRAEYQARSHDGGEDVLDRGGPDPRKQLGVGGGLEAVCKQPGACHCRVLRELDFGILCTARADISSRLTLKAGH